MHMIRKAGFVSHKLLNIHESFIFTNIYNSVGMQIQDSQTERNAD